MSFVKFPDSLPRPVDYLRAGLPRPSQAIATYRSSWAENAVGDEPEAAEFLTSARDEVPRGPRSVTVTGESGELMGVSWAPSTQYLTYPATAPHPTGDVAEVTRSLCGVLDIVYATRGPQGNIHMPAPVDLDTARIVTVDLSVLLAQIDPAKFAINDALYISSALAIEFAVTTGSEPWPGDTIQRFTKPYEWPWSTPVAIDDLILYIYGNLVLNVRPTLRTNTELDRADLLCAATAIAYDTPMYTTKPEAYKGLKNGLRVLTYGPTRNKGALVGGPDGAKKPSGDPARHVPTAAPTVALPTAPDPAPDLTGAEKLRSYYDDGQDFDAHAERMLSQATSSPEELATALCEIFDDRDHNSDPTWRITLLERAEKIAPALRAVKDQHKDVLTAVSSLVGEGQAPGAHPDLVRQAAAALAAYGTWGRWPEDIITDVLVGIEDREPEDLAWYRTFLKIAGAPEAVIDAEMESILDGRIEPSAEHLKQVWSENR